MEEDYSLGCSVSIYCVLERPGVGALGREMSSRGRLWKNKSRNRKLCKHLQIYIDLNIIIFYDFFLTKKNTDNHSSRISTVSPLVHKLTQGKYSSLLSILSIDKVNFFKACVEIFFIFFFPKL